MKNVSLPVILALLGACNAPPGAPGIAIDPAEPTTIDDLVGTIVDRAVDPNDDPVTYAWSWTLDGEASDVTGDTVSADLTSKGQVWEATVLATDDNDATAEVAATVAVEVLNTPPSATATADASAPLSNQDLGLQYETDDIDDDDVSVSISWTRDGVQTSEDGTSVSADLTTKGEVWEATVLPNDGEQDGAAATATFTIDNVAPQVTQVLLTPESPVETTTITAKVSSFDADDDDVTVSFTWFINGEELPGDRGDSLDGADFDKGDVVSVEVVPNDGFMDGEPTISNTVTVINSPPSIARVALDPTELREASKVSCVPSGWADADGDTAQYRYSWMVAGRAAGTDASLDGSSFDKGQKVSCTVTPFDGEEQGAPVTSDVVTVSNTAPTLASASISNKGPKTDDTLTLTLGSTADEDGDKVTVQVSWYVDKKLVATGATLPGSSFSKGQAVYAKATPYDGTDLGAPATTGSVTILNSAPSVTSGSITPGALYTDTLARGAWTTSDADGDKVTVGVEWLVNSRTVGSGTSLNGATSFDKNDRVQVRLTPYDGSAYGAALTTPSVVVKNTAPTAPVAAIDPATPVEGEDDLFCDLTTASTDKDKDKISYTFAWSVDGKAYTDTLTTDYKGDTIDGGDTNEGEKWSCKVTPSDGTEAGTSATSTVVIKATGGEISSFGTPVLQRTESYTWGAWAVDPKRRFGGRVWIMPGYNNVKAIREYASMADMKAGKLRRTISLTYGFDGTGHTIHNGILYYHASNTNRMVRYDIGSGKTTHYTALAGAQYRNKAAYQWGGYSDVDFAYDETGLYVIYATKTRGNITISKLNPSTMAVLKTWTTTRSKNTGNSFMAYGRLYVVKSYSAKTTKIDYIFDTGTGKGKTASIPWTNANGYNAMIDYNYGDKTIYSWDNRRLMTYSTKL